MKRLLPALFVLLSLNASGQPDSSLTQRIYQYLDANCHLDIPTVVNFVYPKLFTIVPKSEIEKQIRQAFDSPDMAIHLEACRIDSIHAPFSLEKGTYTKVDYSFRMLMTFRDDTSDLREVAELIRSQFGPEAKYDDSKRTIIIPVKSDMLAIRNEHSPDWTFIDYRKLKDGFPQLLDAEVWAKLED